MHCMIGKYEYKAQYFLDVFKLIPYLENNEAKHGSGQIYKPGNMDTRIVHSAEANDAKAQWPKR